MGSPRDLRVIALGDSFVAGVGDPDCRGWFGRLVSATAREGIATTAYNLGVRRDTTGDVLARWEREVAVRRSPGCDERLVLSSGVNDGIIVEAGTQCVGTEQSVAHLIRILADADRAGLRTFVVGPPPVADPDVNRRVADLSGRFRAVCDRTGVPFVEVVHELIRDPLWMAEVRDGDGAHPGARGYDRLTAIVLPSWLVSIRPS